MVAAMLTCVIRMTHMADLVARLRGGAVSTPSRYEEP